MSYLLYCIVSARRGPARPSVRGVAGHAVWVLGCGEVCAAVSEAPPAPDRSYDTSGPPPRDLLAHAKVVDAFHRRETVVPMRYGCRFAGIAEARAWARSRSAHLCALMRRLDGCVEMGVRASLLEAGPPALTARSAALSSAAHLAARRNELALALHHDRIAKMLREAMAGCFRECIAEHGCSERRPMLSLYFLVERSRLGAFCTAFGRTAAADAALMLNGPCPPYNFV